MDGSSAADLELRSAALAGSTDAKLALAQRLLSQPPYDILEGIKWARAALAEGSGEAAHLLAIATAEGLGVPQSWPMALDHLCHAAELGCAPARYELAALSGHWRLAQDSPETAAALDWKALRRSVDQASWLRTPAAQPVSTVPRIAVVEKFLSHDVCRWLIERARSGLRRARTIDPDTGGDRYEDASRTNSSIGFDVAHMDMILAFVRARIANLTRLPILGLEDSQVLHYAPGQEFKPHHDFLDVSSPGHARAVAAGGQRVVTFLAYLNEDYEGGETAFPALGWSYKGKAGDALFFYNVAPDGRPDPRTLHAGSPPTRGEKFLLSQWIRFRPS